MANSARKYPLFVNEFFMKCVNSFMKTVVKNALRIEHYWGRVEFVPGRGAIHLHFVAIAKDRAYLQDFYRATSLDEKAKVLNEYAIKHLDMTADVLHTISIILIMHNPTRIMHKRGVLLYIIRLE